jgi:hypothetical protein
MIEIPGDGSVRIERFAQSPLDDQSGTADQLRLV